MALSLTDRVVATAMAAGAGYNTEAVTWPIGKAHRRKRSPNRAEIRKAKRRRCRWLRKHGKTHPDLAVMAADVAACGHHRLRQRCLHPACLRCAPALQRFLVRVVRRLTASDAREAWMAVSVILRPLKPTGEFDFVEEGQRYAAILREAGITRGVFGLDASWNEDRRDRLPEAERFDPHVSVHLWGLVPAVEAVLAKAVLKKLVPRTKAVPRPVHVKPWDGGLGAISYALKPEFEGRHTIEKKGEREGKPVRNTRKRDLTVEQQIQAVRALARAGLTGRLVLLGLRFETIEPGRLRLVPTH
ncbi:hypothetical protein [Methylobacterium sp. WL116]|uniref:hypothetical protein n=1 Tax=Methylobacterium sp. WL116 TaxID=2603889 RepID=UPI0011C902C6|nr:hypothetical protein [Methylobacterium sp. WL116]TXM94967.1 hypothetical protein FV223_02530 [Methylobacterium sp. WL116]